MKRAGGGWEVMFVYDIRCKPRTTILIYHYPYRKYGKIIIYFLNLVLGNLMCLADFLPIKKRIPPIRSLKRQDSLLLLV